jgi:cytochrome c-type biogenesis protein CcmH
MMTELAALIDSGMSEDEIVAAFSEKYGYTVLSSPPASGFNLLAYLLPVIALVIGVAVAIYVARTWRSASVAQGPPADTAGDAAKYGRVEEELRKFTPED